MTTAAGVSTTVAAGWANVAATAVVTGAASNAAISTINNRGNLGAVFKDVVSPDSLEGYAISGVTAGLTAGVYDGLLKTTTVPGTGKVIVDLGTVEGVSRFAANQALQNTTSAALSKALGQEGSFGDALSSSLYNAFAAAGFNFVGDVGDKNELQPGSSPMVIMHALMGGLAAKASGGDFAAGAMAAGVNEAVVEDLNTQFAGMPKDKQDILLTMSSQLVGMLAAGVVSPGADASALDTGAWVAGNSTQYNYLLHRDNAIATVKEAAEGCNSDPRCPTSGREIDQNKVVQALDALASKDKAAVSALDKDTLQFANYMLHVDEGLREEIFIPQTLGEKALDWAKVAIDLFFPSPSGKGKAVVGVGEEITKEAAEALAHGAKGLGSKVDDVVTTSSKPEWLQRLEAGNEFNKVQAKNYPYNELYIQRPDGNGYYRVDSYNPVKGEIVSRKLTQFSEISEATAKSYISEATVKYPAGATIAKVPSSGSLGGQKLQGTVILEVPPQKGVIPQSVLDSANKAGVIIRDTNGKVY